MSRYTTGEMAKQCGVTVRTVQFYDRRGLLVPSGLTEGGRRLYSDEDLRKMKIICFLRETGLSLDTIGRILTEEDPGSVITILLDEQENVLREELAERRDRLEKLEGLKKELKAVPSFTVDAIGDIAVIMENRKKLRALHRNMLLAGIPVAALEIVSVLLWIFRGTWLPFAAWAAIAAVYGVLASRVYFRSTAYICPHCHEVFKPSFKEAFFARHTPKTRRLTCVKCGRKGYCVETWGGDEK